jgi:hypothetical protein
MVWHIRSPYPSNQPPTTNKHLSLPTLTSARIRVSKLHYAQYAQFHHRPIAAAMCCSASSLRNPKSAVVSPSVVAHSITISTITP